MEIIEKNENIIQRQRRPFLFEKPEERKIPHSQVLFGDDKFVILRKFIRSSGSEKIQMMSLISSFDNGENYLKSGVDVSSTRIFRGLNLYQLAPEIVGLNLNNDQLEVNILNFMYQDRSEFFPIGKGFIHLHYSLKTNESPKKNIFEVTDKIVYLNCNEIKTEKIQKPKTKDGFKIRETKAFYFEMNRGFGAAFGTRDEATLFLSLENPSKNLAGYTNQSQINRIMNNVFALFPIFNTNTDENYKSVVLLKTSVGLNDFLVDVGNKPALIKITYPFDGDECYVSHVANIYQ